VKDTSAMKKLEKLIHNMDLPWNRKKDFNSIKLRWLQKNMAKRNINNPDYIEAMTLIQKLIDNG